jgi:hypothetical protein
MRNRRRFRGRLVEETLQLISEACVPLVHNAAVYGYLAGAPHERGLALWVLADAVRAIAGDWSRARLNQGDDESIGLLAVALARAKADRRRFTGMRPVFGDFNGWYLMRVAQASFWMYRERHLHERAAHTSDIAATLHVVPEGRERPASPRASRLWGLSRKSRFLRCFCVKARPPIASGWRGLGSARSSPWISRPSMAPIEPTGAAGPRSIRR